MPALPNVPGVVRIGFRQTLGEDISVFNRVFWQYSGTAPTVLQLNTMATTLMTNWGTHMAPQFTAVHHLVEVDITDLSSATGSVGAATGSVAGSNGGSQNPAATCVLISHRTSRRYRGGHCRTYWCMGDVAQTNDAQTWTGAAVNAFGAAWASFEDDVDAAMAVWGTNIGQCSVSYYSGFTNVLGPTGRERAKPALRGTPVIDTIIADVVSPKFASQRRRNTR